LEAEGRGLGGVVVLDEVVPFDLLLHQPAPHVLVLGSVRKINVVVLQKLVYLSNGLQFVGKNGTVLNSVLRMDRVELILKPLSGGWSQIAPLHHIQIPPVEYIVGVLVGEGEGGRVGQDNVLLLVLAGVGVPRRLPHIRRNLGAFIELSWVGVDLALEVVPTVGAPHLVGDGFLPDGRVVLPLHDAGLLLLSLDHHGLLLVEALEGQVLVRGDGSPELCLGRALVGRRRLALLGDVS